MGLRKMTISKFPWNERCKICGQYTLEGEDIYIYIYIYIYSISSKR